MSDCGVCIGTGDYDRPDFHAAETRTARKPHKCCECRREIKAGEQYQYVSGKWDGRLDTYKTCLVCREIREAFCCDGWLYTQLWEDASEGLFPAMTTGCLSRLQTPAAKQYLIKRWQEWKGL